MPAAAPPPDDPGGLPPRVVTAIAAAVATMAGEPFPTHDRAARRAVAVIRAIQAHTRGGGPGGGV